jgi:tetratricopeptide (TPR) repeat protein
MGRLNIRISVYVCFCMCSFLFVQTAQSFQMGHSANSGYEVRGRVYFGDSQQPAVNVTAVLRDQDGMLRAQVATNRAGRFDFGSVSRGNYAITINAVGYESCISPVSLTEEPALDIIIYLKRLSGEQTAKQSAVSAHELSMPQKARDLMLSGKQKIYFGKDPQGGLEDFESAVAIASSYYEAYYQIGMTYLELGKRNEAGKNFQRSIELSNDKYGEPAIGIGTMMLDKGDNTGGEKMIRHGLELSPNSWLGYYELGRACLKENRVPEAKKAAEQARSLMPTAATVYRLLANIYIRENDYPALLEDLDAYVKLDPDSPTGIHAKEMRAEVLQKILDAKLASASSSPH